jgi:N-acetylglucosaminyl-diphospho-decaprenol L-rhamnosyltransferase
MTPTVDVVIVSYNTEADLNQCLASLHEHKSAHVNEIVVVDNASTDESVTHTRTRWSRVHLITLDKNAGFGAANNIAMRR